MSFRIPTLDGIRAVAFALVFANHAKLAKSYISALGVTIFFFLSGYLITTLLRREYETRGSISLRDFYRRRSLRIFPPAFLALALVWIYTHSPVGDHTGTGRGLASAAFYCYNYATLLFHGVVPPSGLAVLWSLCVEEHFYLLFPLLYIALLRRPRRTQALILAALCIGVMAWRALLVFGLHTSTTGVPRWTYDASDARFDSIFWGCLLAVATNPMFGDRAALLGRRKGLFACAGLLLAGAATYLSNPPVREIFQTTLQGIGLYAVFFFCVSSPRHFAVRWLEWMPLRWVGWVSYSLYLIHYSVLSNLRRETSLTAFPLVMGALGISLAFAWAVRRWIELPIIARRRRLDLAIPMVATR